MELFKLTCATCATKLKVSQLSAIGQILACPRCGSMVQVQPPEGWTPPAEAQAAADAVAAKAAAPRQRLPPDPRLPQTAPVADFEDIETLLNPQAAPPAGGTPATPRGAERRPPPAATSRAREPVAAPPPPGTTSVSHAARQRQKGLLLFMAIAGLLVVAACLVAYLVNAFLNPPRRPGQPEQVAQNPQPDPNGTANPPQTASKEPPGDRAVPQPPPPEIARLIPPAPRLGIPPGVATASAVPPTGIDPANPPPSPPAADSLVSAFSGFEEILRGSESQESLQSVEDAVAANRGRIGIGEVFVRPPNEAPIDVEKNLGFNILGFEFTQQPLVDVLRNLGQATGIPINLDVDLLTAKGISIVQPVDGKFENTTCRGVLDKLLPPLGLGYRVVEQTLWITVANDLAPVTQQFDLSMFPASDPQLASQFAAFVVRTFQPGTWQDNGGSGTATAAGATVTVDNIPAVVGEIERLYQKLVAAQQVRDDPTNAAARQVLASRYQRAQAARQAGIQLQLLEQQPLEVVLGQVGRDFGPQVVVDWQAILADGWTPATEIPWKTDGESLYSYLDQLAHSMQLYVRSVDAQLLQLTSLQVGNTRPELEVYSCAALLQKYSAEALRNRLDRLFENEIQPSTVFLEPGCQCLVAYVPQPLQIRLEAALRNME